ncbi:hypothetical protein H6S82_14620 [Planktothrix sp. FACHB-1355]|uniref:Uncharacterized protein n=1 Tax=Aerosakkonema funiforme FACHB-1375 TaxID=2949571 RepID=A0A926VLW9_9CYAN|nr:MULTISPECIES: hypothetical protein [Oscillatoriales]MBD2185202.1 hypothetical protein [Aerosakkonema funiforme FACHB-1375]MBD3560082.1 hypothetical protein [Planktothrix sp. FACHB-1355]
MSVLVGIRVRSRSVRRERNRTFWDASAGGDGGAIASFFYGILKSDRLPK